MTQHFAHLSDPHLTTLAGARLRELLNKRALGYLSWRRRRRFEHRREVLRALQADLQAQPPQQLLVTGDLTHIGLPAEFAEARDWLQELGDPAQVALVPGNHDACVRAPWEQTFALWRDYLAGDSGAPDIVTYPTVRVRDTVAFIGVSTATPKPPLLATGTAGGAQLERLAALLGELGDRGLFRVVYLHHCPLSNREKWRKRLTDAAPLQALLVQHGAELVLHGHGHRRHYRQLRSRHGTIPVISVPSASALGLHGADIAEYNHYRVAAAPGGWRLDIEVRCYDRDTGKFATGENAMVQLMRRPR